MVLYRVSLENIPKDFHIKSAAGSHHHYDTNTGGNIWKNKFSPILRFDKSLMNFKFFYLG